MKDDKLEKQFGEYFEGVNTSDNITADAKRYVKRKSAFTPKFVKFASVAASCVLVLTATLLIIFGTHSSPPVDDAPPPEANGGAQITYEDGDLSFGFTDLYGVAELSPSLDFINTFANSGASVRNLSAGYMNGELALFKADVSLIHQLARHETEVYVEFTDENTVYSPLADYFDGTEGRYKGVNYYVTRETAENGEPVNKLYFSYGNVKYYFHVTSSDENAYEKYLKAVIK